MAVVETVIGLTLPVGRRLRQGLALLGLTAAGALLPLVLFAARLFTGPHNALTLAALPVRKELELLAAGLMATSSRLRLPTSADAASAISRR